MGAETRTSKNQGFKKSQKSFAVLEASLGSLLYKRSPQTSSTFQTGVAAVGSVAVLLHQSGLARM